MAMMRPWKVCSAIVSGLLGSGVFGAGAESAPPDPDDPVDYFEESVVAVAIGPDVIVGNLDNIRDARFFGYGSVDGISGFAVGTTSCNIGDVNLDWFQDTNRHPVIGQSMYRLKNDRFEHIGQSWLKHGFLALSQNLCFSDCRSTDGTQLGVHCSDPYDAGLNGTQTRLGPKYEVNAHTGYFYYPFMKPPCPGCPGGIIRRLQVKNGDLDPSINAGALYFVEGHYITPDDAAAGNANNNASYRPVTICTGGACLGGACPVGQYCLTLTGTTKRTRAAIRAWNDTNGAICADKVCAGGANDGKACTISDDCPSPGVCAAKVCAGGVNDGRACELPSDCPSPGVCAEKVCAGGVHDGEACAVSLDCEPVVETDVQVPNEGLFILAAKATDLGTGLWHYEYALQNFNSDRSGGSFTVPLPEGTFIPPESIGFHDVDYHSGDGVVCPGCVCASGSQVGQPCTSNADCPLSTCSGTPTNFDGTDWTATVQVGKITWATTPHNVNPNANALRWGTLYNFRFDANVDPANVMVTLGLFKPGSPSEMVIQTTGPRLGIIDCNENGIPDACDVDCNAPGCGPPCGPTCTGGPRDGLSCADHEDCPDAQCAGLDCNDNRVPDECEVPPISPAGDCNQNGIPDTCDILFCPPDDPRCGDCQPNNVPDECDIRDCPPQFLSCQDCNDNGIPDGCEPVRDCDGDGVEDCDDLCPCTTPVGACLPPFEQQVICCFPSFIWSPGFTWSQCIASGGTPVCDDPIICPGTPCPESSCREGCLLGDWDRDGDLDLFDVYALQSCYSASSGSPAFVAPSVECRFIFDFNDDGDVDLEDVRGFLDSFTGP